MNAEQGTGTVCRCGRGAHPWVRKVGFTRVHTPVRLTAAEAPAAEQSSTGSYQTARSTTERQTTDYASDSRRRSNEITMEPQWKHNGITMKSQIALEIQ